MGKRLFLVVILAGVLAAAADATIVVQRGMAGVSIGMSQKKVRSVLGRPTEVIHGLNAVGAFVEYRYPRVTVDFQGSGPLSNVSTARRRDRTAKGVGVGSTQKQVHQKVRGASCNDTLCSVGKRLPGRIVTTFYLRQGIVILVAVGRLVD